MEETKLNTPLNSTANHSYVINTSNLLPEDMGQIQEPEVVASPRVSELSSLDNATSYVPFFSEDEEEEKNHKYASYDWENIIFDEEVYATTESSTADSQTLSEAESKSPQYDEKISKQALEENTVFSIKFK